MGLGKGALAAKGGGHFGFPVIPGQNPWLDVLRAIAVLVVVGRHGAYDPARYPELFDGATAGAWLSATLNNGWVGVDLFFVLSGFLIGASLLKRMQTRKAYAWDYFRARILRIVPAFLVVMLVIMSGVVPFFEVRSNDLTRSFWVHALMLQDYLRADINIAFWSLGVEEKFYIVAPLLVGTLLALPAKRGLRVLALLLFMSPVARTMGFVFHPPANYAGFFYDLRSPFHMCLEPLVLGVSVAYAQHQGWLRMGVSRAKWALGGSLAVLAGWMMAGDSMAVLSLWDAMVQPLFLAVLCAVMVAAAVELKAVRVRGEAGFRTVARLSYALYLVHGPVIPMCLFAATALGVGALGFWGLYLVAAFAAAAALHFAVEKPFLHLKDRLTARDRARRPVSGFAKA